jgi:arginyl-tRNA synthetase
MLDLSVSLGNILTIGTFLTGGVAFVYTIRTDVAMQAQRITMMQEGNGMRLSNLEGEVRTLRDVLVTLAQQGARLDILEEMIADMRREGRNGNSH